MQDTSDIATFNQRRQLCASLIEKRLEDLLYAASSSASVPVPQRLADAMHHAVMGGGKRLRPFLMMECARFCGLPYEETLNAACALEFLHCYSLVHDDLPAMDDDDLRRGQPTVHRAFDEATAILAGDALLTLAFEIMTSAATHRDPAIRGELAFLLARAAGPAGMVGGQMLDLLASEGQLNENEVFRLQGMKTGALLIFACEAGAILAQAEPDRRHALHDYGNALGLAYQLADDLLDVEGDEATVGKAVAKDKDAGKATIVGLIGIEAAREKLFHFEKHAQDALAPFGAAASTLADAAHYIATRRR